jgi:hypothetical protein
MSKTSLKVAGFIGTMVQIVPMTVVTITNSVPLWARIDMGIWLVLWAVVQLIEVES